ncbi:oxygen-insensitive NADPH nitroreductase [Salisediminibacterium beveridgei]|uniref:NADPH-dependent nitro/flavin reductase n=1 Tax=Salisediminibacterium beveridgei TaxID=632773 RepID=A0A1D7QWI6_9BACI|nr:oxygen-insensitive NADPH nitroreductase [Salisediminibacterium beveridgei]AOM83339.1 NADPH-dependent nitro/flavin reductase [Salisediminibacterium beveridgei]
MDDILHNETINTLLNHRSIRSFENSPISGEQIQTIIQAAQSASSSSFIQAYSIIGVKDPEKKRLLAEYAGNQPYVAENGHFLVFCADMHRHVLAAEIENLDPELIRPSLESTEKFLVSVVDATLAAQNAAAAAESMGFGICYIGGIRNQLDKVMELLSCPPYVLPLFGMAIGVPSKSSDQKPRLPFNHVYHEDTYQPDDNQLKEDLKKYNQTISGYYKDRTSGKRKDRWTEQMMTLLERRSRMTMRHLIQQQGFMKDESNE